MELSFRHPFLRLSPSGLTVCIATFNCSDGYLATVLGAWGAAGRSDAALEG